MLTNTAIAMVKDPVAMARAMKLAVEAGRLASGVARYAKPRVRWRGRSDASAKMNNATKFTPTTASAQADGWLGGVEHDEFDPRGNNLFGSLAGRSAMRKNSSLPAGNESRAKATPDRGV